MFGYITLITGFALSVVAAVFAIFGIVALFAGLPIFAGIMGIVIELGKVVAVVWVYRNWDEKTKLKFVMIPFVLMMMVLTSGGIFGLLSKAHVEQTAPVTNNTAKIERLDQRIARERTEITDAELIIDQLDDTVRVLVDARKISHPTEGSKIVRINQQPQRDQLKGIINESMDTIDEYEDAKLVLNQELNELELELGPVKYIAAIIYEEPADQIDEAVRMVIMAFIFVFDPMAILLLMAGNYTLMGRVGAAPVRKEKGSDTSPSQRKKLVANADAEFVPAEVIAEVMADAINEAKIQSTKAKSADIPAEPTEGENRHDFQNRPHGQGIYSPQFYKDKGKE